MTVDCSWELQKAVYAALSGDGTLSGMVSGVFSHVPQDTVFPYIKFDSIRSLDWSSKSTSGVQVTLNLAVFSRGRGVKEALNIMAEIKRILGDSTLSMTGCTIVSLKFIESKATHLADGTTWLGNIVFNALVEKS
jgi:hypothetical protein